uniref:Uncharacterized protein n=1 Tax=Leviviridae sp. TaxID=2027243 RepID=A0A514DAG9_9VIRU|nr:MAG: hypothetical protein H1RhizoLitter245_000002 [Leviviridae sp.]
MNTKTIIKATISNDVLQGTQYSVVFGCQAHPDFQVRFEIARVNNHRDGTKTYTRARMGNSVQVRDAVLLISSRYKLPTIRIVRSSFLREDLIADILKWVIPSEGTLPEYERKFATYMCEYDGLIEIELEFSISSHPESGGVNSRIQ